MSWETGFTSTMIQWDLMGLVQPFPSSRIYLAIHRHTSLLNEDSSVIQATQWRFISHSKCQFRIHVIIESACPKMEDTPNSPNKSIFLAKVMIKSAGLPACLNVAGMALRDIQMCFVTCLKSFCVAGAKLLQRFHTMRGSFRGRRSTLDVSIIILRGRRSTLDVSCCVFFTNRSGRAASSGDKVQIPWQAWQFVRCGENWRKPRTKHRFWSSNYLVVPFC